ncbi:hypothetical protein VM636_18395 [Streptomyces sp. SCSIO 75703]|uniref:hypothetical protein n=1 Tax=Streptomyces sp. SCSIO 75703 TaxID=3112165 RepID=UPI0030CFFE39
MEGERTASPPVCVPCAGISVQLCPRLLRHHVAATVASASAWGVTGIVHDPATLQPMGGDEKKVAYESLSARWVVAAQVVVELHGVTLDRAARPLRPSCCCLLAGGRGQRLRLVRPHTPTALAPCSAFAGHPGAHRTADQGGSRPAPAL